jgi:lactoylglutathione lyase
MEIKRIDHMTIVIKDLKKTQAFYGELLGLKQLPSVNLGDHLLHYFAIPGGQKLELTEYLYPVHDHKGELNDRGSYRHLAFEVTDIYGWEKKITEAGYPFHIPVAPSPELGFTGGLLRDPNGVEIELLEYNIP